MESNDNKRTESKDCSELTCAVAQDIKVQTSPLTPQFTRSYVASQEDRIRLVDADEESGLELFCYNRCSNEDDDFLKQCRGLVFHGEKLVLKALSYASEYSHLDKELETALTDFKSWSFYPSYEGALLRLFYFSGKWFLSTHRKLDAFRSKWSSKESFGTLFLRALDDEVAKNSSLKNFLGTGEAGETNLERLQNVLDKNNQYMFLLRNTADNRIVCSVPSEKSEPLLFHVGTYVNNSPNLNTEDNIHIPRPKKLRFLNVDELRAFVDTEVDYTKLQGVIGFGPNSAQVKVLHATYQEMFRARGNEPSVKFRYLQVRMNKKMTELLYKLYPDSVSVFDDYENIIYDVAESIYKAYIQRFIKKCYVTVPREEFIVMRDCHAWHLQNREENRICLEKVITTLNKQPPTNINSMIRRFKIERAKKNTLQPRDHKGSRNSSPAIVGVSAPVNILKRLLPPKLG